MPFKSSNVNQILKNFDNFKTNRFLSNCRRFQIFKYLNCFLIFAIRFWVISLLAYALTRSWRCTNATSVIIASGCDVTFSLLSWNITFPNSAKCLTFSCDNRIQAASWYCYPSICYATNLGNSIFAFLTIIWTFGSRGTFAFSLFIDY